MYCNKCAVKVNDDDIYCYNCGNKLKDEYQIAIDTYKKSTVQSQQVNTKNPFNAFAIVALVLGIVSLVAFFTYFLDINILVNDLFSIDGSGLLLSTNGIVAGILGIFSEKNKGKAITGLVLSSVATLLSLLELIIFYL